MQTTLSERYRLTALLGRGGMADVYRADDLSLERPVAVKLLRTAAPDDARRFTAEARVLSRLNHEHVVRLFDAGVHEGVPYFVMQLVEGRSLRGLLAEGPLGAEEVRRIGVGLADALAHAHAFGIVHRDVKPGNVLVDAEGNVRLADFGIARLADATRLTATGSVLGTAAYAAPEQLRGDRLGPATDVYSMGLVLLEALAGRRDSAPTAVETALSRLTRDPDIPEDVPAEWTSLLRALTARAPADRPD
ncbi:MAG: serine/threonine protein kinase, partial [Actinomycetota bacterium]|nr:serine/threonine protein kinase [Actinomycetota bacterium]